MCPIPYDEICAAVARHRGDDTDGSLLAVFLDRFGTVALTVGFDEGTRYVDELFLQHIVAIVADLRVAAVVFAVIRAAGRPTRIDRRLWRELVTRLGGASTDLRDVIVVGDDQWWSAVSGQSRSRSKAL